jgi:predicted ATPase
VHVSRLRFRRLRRFTDLTIEGLAATTRLVVLAGPNGTGKSSLFDGFRVWLGAHGGLSAIFEEDYHHKKGTPDVNNRDSAEVDFYEGTPSTPEGWHKTFYFRSAYRNDPAFALRQLRRLGSAIWQPRITRMIDNDVAVSANYERLVSRTIEGVFSGEQDSRNVGELRNLLIGSVRQSMERLFDGLTISGTGDPLGDGTFVFDKGSSRDFPYKNLSGGEKAAFDLILDIVLKRESYDDTIYCIDEPESHLNTRLQSTLLGELLELLPPRCQLWIASHSIGMLRKARDLQRANPEEVAFLDFENREFDSPVVMTPTPISREFWGRTLRVALHDLATLVGPERIVLCEGRPSGAGNDEKAEFDAKCYRRIFEAEYPETDFVSVGNAADVHNDRLELGRAMQAIISGTKVVRLIDRDDRSREEISELERAGTRVLRRRQLESYLLDDEILGALCDSVNQTAALPGVLAVKRQAVEESIGRGKPRDDLKSASAQLCADVKRILGLTQAGSDARAFMRDTLSLLVVRGTTTYAALKKDIFDE